MTYTAFKEEPQELDDCYFRSVFKKATNWKKEAFSTYHHVLGFQFKNLTRNI